MAVRSKVRHRPAGWRAPGPAPTAGRVASPGRSSWCWCVSVPSGGGVVLLCHAGRDTPALADRDALVLRPGPDITAALTACRRARRPAGWSPRGFAGMLHEGGDLLTERSSVLLVQVDLILCAAEPEPHGLSCWAAIKVVFQRDGYSLSHPSL